MANHLCSSKSQWQAMVLPRSLANCQAASSPPMPASCRLELRSVHFACSTDVGSIHPLCILQSSSHRRFSFREPPTPTIPDLAVCGEGALIPAPTPGWPCDPELAEAEALVLGWPWDQVTTTGSQPKLWLKLSSTCRWKPRLLGAKFPPPEGESAQERS